MNDLLVTRLVCLFGLMIGTLIMGILPLYVRSRLKCGVTGANCDSNCRCRRDKRIINCLTFFGGGVLLGTTFLHLLPEAREGFRNDGTKNCSTGNNSTDDGKDHETFAMPEFIMCCGFFAVYLCEVVIHYCLGKSGHSHAPLPENTTINSNYGSCNQISDIPSCGPESGRIVTDPSMPLIGDDPQTAIPPLTIGAILTFIALSFHSIFEGVAIGLRPDAISTAIVFIAIAIHKFVLAFVIGLQFVAECSRRTRKHLFIWVTIFAVTSPMGMAIAMGTEKNIEDSSPLAISILTCIATGTLLYVTFFEILLGNKNEDLSSLGKFMSTAFGFVTLALIRFGSTFT